MVVCVQYTVYYVSWLHITFFFYRVGGGGEKRDCRRFYITIAYLYSKDFFVLGEGGGDRESSLSGKSQGLPPPPSHCITIHV